MPPLLLLEGEVKAQNFRCFSTSSTDEKHMLKLDRPTKLELKVGITDINTTLNNEQSARSYDL